MATCAAEADSENISDPDPETVKMFICNLPYEEAGKKMHRNIISGTNNVKRRSYTFLNLSTRLYPNHAQYYLNLK
jgi:hypothetical protein